MRSWFGLQQSRLVQLVSALVLLTASCRREVSAAETAENTSTPAANSTVAHDSNRDAEVFALSLERSASYSVGKVGELTLQLVAKAPYHINKEYPHKLKLRAVDGISFPKLVLGRESMTIERTRATMKVPFTPARAGTFAVSGEFAFSLCTEDRCLMEKRSVSTQFNVSNK
jgi:hypothetical protein